MPFFYFTLLPNGATLTYTAQSGAIHIPAASLGTYSTTQFTIPISGGSFTLIDPTGTGNATVTLNSVLTPLGTTTLTLNAPNLSSSSPVIRFASYFITPTLTANLGGLANGTVALSDGRTATVTNRLIALRANTQVTNLPGGEYVQGANVLTTPVTIQGTIMSGSVSVPESAVTALPTPVQPPPPVIEQKVVVEKQIILVTPPIIVVEPPKKQELALGFAKNVTLREPYEFLNEEPAHHRKKRVDPDDLPEVERSALELSRIHPGLHGRP